MNEFDKILWGFIFSVIGIVFGWMLNQAGQWFRTRQEDQKNLKVVLYNLLETYFIFIRSDFDKFIQKITDKVHSKIPVNEQSPEIKMLMQSIYTGILTDYLKPELIKDLKVIKEGYQNSIKKSARTNGYSGYNPVGPAKMLAVSTGDKVYMETYAKYNQVTGSNSVITAATLLAAFTTPFGIVNAGETATLYQSFNSNLPGVSAGMGSSTTVPKTYLVWLFFNSSYQFVNAGGQAITTSAYNAFEKLSRSFTATQNGFLYIYVANESAAANVYFDETYIVHEKNNVTLQVVQASDYYPFGLSFNQYQADRLKETSPGNFEPELRNRYLFQRQELQKDLDLGWYQFKWRMHDPAIGRFGAVDPLSEKYVHNSPFAFAENRLIDGVELEGLEWRNSTREEVESFMNNGNSVGEGEVGFIRAVGGGERGYFTFVGETQYQTTCDASGNECIEPITFNSKAFYSNYMNTLEILHRSGTVLTYSPNNSGMIKLPSSGQVATGLGSLGNFEIGGEHLYSYYNRNDVANPPSDQWAKPEVLTGLLNSIFSYKDLYPNDIVHIGDMRSPSNGPVNIDASRTHHSNRGAIDIRYIGNNGGSYQGQYNNAQFSATRNRDFIFLMGQNGFSQAIVAPGIRTRVTSFGIQVIGDSRGQHNDHMHFDLNR